MDKQTIRLQLAEWHEFSHLAAMYCAQFGGCREQAARFIEHGIRRGTDFCLLGVDANTGSVRCGVYFRIEPVWSSPQERLARPIFTFGDFSPEVQDAYRPLAERLCNALDLRVAWSNNHTTKGF